MIYVLMIDNICSTPSITNMEANMMIIKQFMIDNGLNTIYLLKNPYKFKYNINDTVYPDLIENEIYYMINLDTDPTQIDDDSFAKALISFIESFQTTLKNNEIILCENKKIMNKLDETLAQNDSTLSTVNKLQENVNKLWISTSKCQDFLINILGYEPSQEEKK